MSRSTPKTALDRRRFLKVGAGVLGSSLVAPSLLAACGSSGSSSTAASSSTTLADTDVGTAVGGPKLLAAAQAEGTLNTVAIGVPNSYYDGVITAFEKYAGFKVNALNDSYPPAAEVDDLVADKAAGKPPRFDVAELPPDHIDDAVQKGLLDPYQSTLWDDIPSSLKDPDGNWSAAYFGTLSFLTDVTVMGAPITSWSELSEKGKPGSFAMLGDPRTGQQLAGGLGLLTVMSASLANGGSLDNAAPGLDLLADLINKGIFVPSDTGALFGIPDTAGRGQFSVRALFSFDLPLAQYSAGLHKHQIEGSAPTDGLLASFYAQGIAKGTPHIDSSKLWIEFLQSDQGAEAFLRNGAIPARHAALRGTSSVPLSTRRLLPSASVTNAPIPTQDQVAAAQAVIDAQWSDKIL